MRFKQYESHGWGGVGGLLANGQFKAVYPEAAGCDAFGQYIIDQPPACLDKGCQYQPSEPLKGSQPLKHEQV